MHHPNKKFISHSPFDAHRNLHAHHTHVNKEDVVAYFAPTHSLLLQHLFHRLHDQEYLVSIIVDYPFAANKDPKKLTSSVHQTKPRMVDYGTITSTPWHMHHKKKLHQKKEDIRTWLVSQL